MKKSRILFSIPEGNNVLKLTIADEALVDAIFDPLGANESFHVLTK